MKTFASRHVVAVAASGLIVAFLSGGGARAVTDTIFKYSTAHTGYYDIEAAALVPADNAAAGNYTKLFTDGYMTGTGCYLATPHLPNGATITALSVWYASDASSDPIFHFVRHDLVGGSKLGIVTSAALHDDTAERVHHTFPVPPSAGKVINSNYGYTFAFCGQRNHDWFWGARVAYTYTNAGD
ncbi:MAG TPA: hypothetical protein VHD59_01350 [Pseudolabrys sp.]|jgi:hypothetical protein|nr:hypothetical protein [Pseudolabrys sp.]